jgi:hypothetical protein
MWSGPLPRARFSAQARTSGSAAREALSPTLD